MTVIQRILSFLILIFLPTMLFGQDIAKPKVLTNNIYGLVVDENNKPLEYITVVLYKLPDSSLVTGTLTKNNGKFELLNIKQGNYFLKASFIGYQTKIIAKIQLSNKSGNIKLDTLKMLPKSDELDEVVVLGNQKKVDVRADKKVVYVEKDADAATGTAIDVLQKMPSVSVDVEGNVTLRNRSDILVLIDGKPSTLQVSDALSSISASMIDRIEIIDNPSAKYESGGLGGIINIILKKKVTNGYGGMLNISDGLQHKQKAELSLEYNKDIFQLDCQAKYSDIADYGQTKRTRYYTQNGDTFNLNDHFNRIWSQGDNMFKVGLGIKLPKFDCGIDFKIGEMKIGSIKDGGQRVWKSSALGDTFTISNNSRLINYKYNDVSANFDFKFNKPEHTLKNILLFSTNNGNNVFTANAWDADNNYNQSTFLEQDIAQQLIKMTVLRFQSDYTLPLSKSNKIEAGIMLTDDIENMNYANSDSTATGNIPTTHTMDSYTNVNAMYALFHGSLSTKFTYQLGARGEYTRRLIQTDISNYNYDKVNLYPSLLAEYKFTDSLSISGSINQRISQPDPWLLVPFSYRNDLYNQAVGNPYLKPQELTNYELTLSRNFKQIGSLSVNAFYREIANNILQFSTQFNNNLYQYTYLNVDKDRTTGAEILVSPKIPKPFSLDLNVSLFREFIYMNIDSVTNRKLLNGTGDTIINSANFRAEFKATIGIDVTKSTHAQIYFTYLSTEKGPEMKDTPLYFTNVSLKQEFLKKSLVISFKATDIFNTGKNSVTITSWNNSHETYSRWRYPTYMVSITYNFHNYKNSKNNEFKVERGGL